MQNGDFPICAYCGFWRQFENRAVDIQNSNLTYQNDAKQCYKPLRTTLPLNRSLEKRPGNSGKCRFPYVRIVDLYTHRGLRADFSVLPCLIFSYGHLDLKKDWFFDIWALFTRKMKSETVIFDPNGPKMHFWVVSHPTGTSGCFRASWPYFQLLRPSRLQKRLIFRYLGTFY